MIARAVLSFLLLAGLVAPAWAVELIERQTTKHDIIRPGVSHNLVIFHDQERIPLATILGFRRSTTIVYTIERVTKYIVVIRAYNYGIFSQHGEVTIGFWD